MKALKSARNVEVFSAQSKAFTVKASGKVFSLLISGLYSDKPQSITREIYSNAFDAHAMTGQHDRPFDVNYPTHLNPTFTVRDYGTGISHEQMQELYTVLGHSTKEGTNDAVGKWGVGRMSPMSYTDTFTVTSRHKGNKAFYSVQLGPNGEPALHTMAMPTPTDEPDGLEVSFPLQRKDIEDFKRAARRMALGMKVKPNVTNDENPFEEYESVISGDGWVLFKHPDYYGYRRQVCLARMGCVTYPIAEVYVPSEFRGKNILIDFGIGDLDVTASREGLSYDPETVKNIEAAFERITTEITRRVEDDVANARNAYEATKVFFTFRFNFNLGIKGTKYKGQDITYYYKLPVKLVSASFVDKGYTRSKTVGWSGCSSLDLTPRDTTHVFIQDTNTKSRDVRAPERIMIYHQENNLKGGNPWFRYDSSDPVQVAELQSIKDTFLDLVTFVYVKDIPDPGNTAKRSKTKVKFLGQGSNYWNDYDLDATEFNTGGIWMPITSNEPDDRHWRVYRKLVGTSVVVVPKTHHKKFREATQWKELKDEATKVYNKHKDQIKEHSRLYESPLRLVDDKPLCPEQKILLDLTKKSKELLLDKWDASTCDDMVVAFEGSRIEQLRPKVYKAMLDNYPLLEYYDLKHHKQFADYVKSIQNKGTN